jgi:hypothetical protein
MESGLGQLFWSKTQTMDVAVFDGAIAIWLGCRRIKPPNSATRILEAGIQGLKGVLAVYI